MINLKLLSYQLKSKRKGLVYFSLSLFAWGFLITALYPTVSGIEAFSDYWGQFPDTLKNLFGGHEVNILTAEGFLTLEYYQMFLPIILAAFAFGMAAFCVVKAKENGSLEVLLTHPLERWRYALTSFATIVIGLAALSVVAVSCVMFTSLVFSVDLSYAGQMRFMLLAFLLVLSLGSISLFASCIARKSGQVYAVGMTALAVAYLVNFLANTWSFFRILDHALPFHYYDPYGIMTSTGFPWSSLLYYPAVSIAFAVFSMLALQRRDINS